MYTKYESAFYYKNPEIQLIINLQRITDELGELLHIDYCDRCMGLKCKCLDVATVEADTAVNDRTAETTQGYTADTAVNDTTAEAAKGKMKVLTAEPTIARKDVSTVRAMKDAKIVGMPSAWTKAANAVTKDTRTTATTTWFKDMTTAKDVKTIATKDSKWSFKFSPLNIEEDMWRRADRWRRPLEEKYLTSETVEEFFQSIRKRAVECS